MNENKQPIIVIDTRERCPYRFREYQTVTRKLDTGDYSVQGIENIVTVERKMLDDYVNTVLYAFREADGTPLRFENELNRMREFKYRAIVVEGTWQDLDDRRFQSRVHPNSIKGLTVRIIQDFQTPVHFAGNSVQAEDFTLRFLKRAWRKEQA